MLAIRTLSDAESGWSGELWIGAHLALMHGTAAPTSAHAHYAHQLLLCESGEISVQLDGQTISAPRILIPSLRRHAIQQTTAPLFTVFAEPLTISVDTLLRVVPSTPLTLRRLASALSQRRPLPALDRRVQRALAEVDALLGSSTLRADLLARKVHLSLSQLERLFGAQVGLPVRRLILWRRLRLAIAFVFEQHTLTAAAHAAGFADAAHFSRTMRAMFGVRADRSVLRMMLRHLDD